jgi:hypothetical protein
MHGKTCHILTGVEIIGNQVIWLATEKELESNSKALKYLIDQVFHSGLICL